MAVEVAMEDDLFFADLNRQISLLIDEDEDPVSHFPLVSSQGFSQSMLVHPQILPSQYNLYQENCIKDISKGTGVFIPQSSQPRRRYKQQATKRSANSYGAKSNNKQLPNSRAKPINNRN